MAPGAQVGMSWWEQEGFDLAGEQESAAEEGGGGDE